MKTEIYPSYSAFLAREDKTINGVSQAFADANPTWAEERENEGCWNCSDYARKWPAPPRFYETNEVAMADILRCAELEKKGGE